MGSREPEVNGGVLGTGKQQLKTQIDQRINGQTRGVADIVRGPDKRERLQEFLLAKLPYHPQWVRKGTRFDAELREPLEFRSVTVKTETLQSTGQEAVVPLETRNARRTCWPSIKRSLATELALASASNQAAGVPVVLRDDTGVNRNYLEPDSITQPNAIWLCRIDSFSLSR